METTVNLVPFIISAIFPEKSKSKPKTQTMSHTQDKAHSSAMLGAILDGEKAQQQQQQQPQTSSDSASIFSTSSFGSAKALLKKYSKSSKKDTSSSSPSSGSSSGPTTEAELLRTAQKNQVRMGF
ncbi:hypothetical protein F4805DRAFT_173398 [Annulohypoxylon moriforme]|nr:hypothetical protein F4805DRAFT_173398 [Annulohypoxylon moriforme]